MFDPSSENWTLLLVYSGAMALIALWLALQRVRWLRGEQLVRQRLLAVIDAIPDPAAVRDVRGRYVM